MKLFRLLPWLILLLFSCNSKPDETTLTIYCTTDVHGNLFDYDLKKDEVTLNSLTGVASYLNQQRCAGDSNYILLDAGDILQGQPSNYYFNFIDTNQVNITARMMNAMGYDAAAVGNHDIETGHSVFNKVKQEFRFPWLAANAINTATGQPYFTPYTIITRNNLKIAILGLITPGIPKWLPTHLWKGIEFIDMVESARQWVPYIREKEKPDLLIGLFHAGTDYNYAGENATTTCNENATVLVAQQIDGFDIIISGHDHKQTTQTITNDAGNTILLLDPASHTSILGKISIQLKRQGDQYQKEYVTEFINPAQAPRDSAFIQQFTSDFQQIKNYIDTPLGEFMEELPSQDAVFGPSAFTDFIHNAQLRETKADISFSTLLQLNARIAKGIVTIRDMFNLYKYENGLYIMQLNGEEVKKYLEYAYSLQYNTMTSSKDHLLKFKTDTQGDIQPKANGKYSLAADFFNYSCAAGIKYTVDVSKEPGKRITIHTMSDGRPFHPDSTYSVAINSYRGNGGGGHLTLGVGLSKQEMPKRIINILPHDVRYYITEYIKEKKQLTPQCRNDWKVIPTSWFEAGKKRDSQLIFDEH